jgi:hypothetical protein
MKKLIALFILIISCATASFAQEIKASGIKKGTTIVANSNQGLDCDTVTNIPTKLYLQNYVAAHTGVSAWGSITGTLSNQTDLQSALNAKQNSVITGTSLQYFRGDLSLATFPTNLNSFTNGPGYITGLAWGGITGTLSNQSDLQAALNAKQNNITTGTTFQYFRGDLSLSTFPTNLSSFTNGPGYITGVAWGAITGTLSLQTDLQSALNAKQATITTGSTGQYFRGDLSLATFPTAISSFSNDAGYTTATSTTIFTNKSGNISQWTNDAGYLTSVSTPTLLDVTTAGAYTDQPITLKGQSQALIFDGLGENPFLIDAAEADPDFEYGIGRAKSDKTYSGREAFSFHVNTDHSFHWFSSDWRKLMELEGGTGNLTLAGGATILGSAHIVSELNVDGSILGANLSGTNTGDQDLSSYVQTHRSINTTSPLHGGGDLSSDLPLTIDNAAADGLTKGAAAFTASDFNSLGGIVSLDYTNWSGLFKANNLSELTSASTARTNLGLGTLATQSGTFSGTSSGTNTGDQTITLTGDVTGSGTGSFAASIGSGKVTNTMLAGSIDATKINTGVVSNTEFNTLDGVSSAIQTQIDGKQPLDADLTTIAGLTATTDNFVVSVFSAWASRTPAQVKSTLSLNNVENTALSTWAGSSNITTTGTLTSGTIGSGFTAIANARLANSTISGISLGSNLGDLTATNSTLTFSGTYNGSAARTIGLNLNSANTWAVDQSVPDEAYDPTAWNGSLEVPTKNAIRDKLETLGGGGTVTSIATTSPITGGTITTTGTIGIDNAAADGSTKGAASFTAADFNATTGNISLDYTNWSGLTKSNNLSDVSNQITSRQNLGTADGYLTSTYTNATQSHTNVTGITFTIPANQTWSFEIYGAGQLSGASGARFVITYSNTPTTSMIWQLSNAASLVAQADYVTLAIPPVECGTIMNVATTEELFKIGGCVVNSGTSCTVQLQARAVGSSQTLTIRPGTYFTARRIN